MGIGEDVVLVNKDNQKVGIGIKEKIHKNPVKLHRAISVVLLDKEGKKMLIQKRSDSKKTWPGFWANTCCSHPYPKESFKVAAQRRLFEEMGIKANLKEALRFIYQAHYNNEWGENEYDVVFLGRYNGDFKPDKNEISEAKWIAIDDLKSDIKKNTNKYAPWFRLIFEKLAL